MSDPEAESLTRAEAREVAREEFQKLVEEELEDRRDGQERDDLDANTAKAASLLTRRELLAGVAGGTAASVGVMAATDAATADSSQAGSFGTAANPADFHSDDHFANDHAPGGLSMPPSGYLNFGFEDGTPRYLDAAGNVRDLTPFTDGDGDGIYDLPNAGDGIGVGSVDTGQIGNNGASVNFTDTVEIGSQNALLSVAASGQTTLASGIATVNTAISAVDATFYLALGVDDPNADVKVAGRLFWDDSAGTYKVEILEDGTAVGNPTVNYDVLRVR